MTFFGLTLLNTDCDEVWIHMHKEDLIGIVVIGLRAVVVYHTVVDKSHITYLGVCPRGNDYFALLTVVSSVISCRSCLANYSRVKNGNSVTILQQTCSFDD